MTLGAVSFYDFLKKENAGKKVFVCNGSACLCAGTQEKLHDDLAPAFQGGGNRPHLLPRPLPSGRGVSVSRGGITPARTHAQLDDALRDGRRRCRGPLRGGVRAAGADPHRAVSRHRGLLRAAAGMVRARAATRCRRNCGTRSCAAAAARASRCISNGSPAARRRAR